jgi:hypothetical protein
MSDQPFGWALYPKGALMRRTLKLLAAVVLSFGMVTGVGAQSAQTQAEGEEGEWRGILLLPDWTVDPCGLPCTPVNGPYIWIPCPCYQLPDIGA